MTKEEIVKNWGKITLSQLSEFHLISKNQPVFAGNLASTYDANSLIELGFVMMYEGEYVLTEAGKELKQMMMEGALKIAKQSALKH
jgi:hypothetical protein